MTSQPTLRGDEKNDEHQPERGPIPFPSDTATSTPATSSPDSAKNAIDAVQTMSRKIQDLARELNCLGYFDDEDDDRPRAA